MSVEAAIESVQEAVAFFKLHASPFTAPGTVALARQVHHDMDTVVCNPSLRHIADDCVEDFINDFGRAKYPVIMRPRALRLRDSGLLGIARRTLPEQCKCIDKFLDLTDSPENRAVLRRGLPETSESPRERPRTPPGDGL